MDAAIPILDVFRRAGFRYRIEAVSEGKVQIRIETVPDELHVHPLYIAPVTVSLAEIESPSSLFVHGRTPERLEFFDPDRTGRYGGYPAGFRRLPLDPRQSRVTRPGDRMPEPHITAAAALDDLGW